jgi:hypothetical protein
MAQQELDLLQFAACGRHRRARSWGANAVIPSRVAQALTTYQMTFWVMPLPHTVPFFRIERNSLPLATGALSVQRSTVAFTQACTGTVRTWPAFPTRSTIAQWSSRF